MIINVYLLMSSLCDIDWHKSEFVDDYSEAIAYLKVEAPCILFRVTLSEDNVLTSFKVDRHEQLFVPIIASELNQLYWHLPLTRDSLLEFSLCNIGSLSSYHSQSVGRKKTSKLRPKGNSASQK